MSRKKAERFVQRLHTLCLLLGYFTWISFGRVFKMVSYYDAVRNPIGTIIFLGSYCVWLWYLGKVSHIRILRTPTIEFKNNSLHRTMKGENKDE